MCTFSTCPKADTMYERRSQWFEHELQVHRREWCCNAIDHRAYEDPTRFLDHMRNVHADTYDQAELPNILSLFERPSSNTTAACPFCFSEDTKRLPMTRFEKHLGRHMEILALFALPRNLDKASGFSADIERSIEGSEDVSELDTPRKFTRKDCLESISDGSDRDEIDEGIPLKESTRVSRVIQNFCIVEAANEMKVPKNCVLNFNTRFPIKHKFSDTGLQDDLTKKISAYIDRQPDGDVNLLNLLSILDFDSDVVDQMDDRHNRINETELSHCLTSQVTSIQESLESSDAVSWDVKDRIRQLVIDLDLECGADVSWDFMQPKVAAATSTLAIRSRSLAAIDNLINITADHQMYRKVCGELKALGFYLYKARLEHHIAKEVEERILSQEAWFREFKIHTNLDGSSLVETSAHEGAVNDVLTVVHSIRSLIGEDVS